MVYNDNDNYHVNKGITRERKVLTLFHKVGSVFLLWNKKGRKLVKQVLTRVQWSCIHVLMAPSWMNSPNETYCRS